MMRLVFLILLLANVAAFFLLRGGNGVPAPSIPQPVVSAKPLKLLSELSPAERAALAHPAAVKSSAVVETPAAAVSSPAVGSLGTAAVAAPRVCASYGPFAGEEAAQAAAKRLKRAGAEIHERLVPGKVRLGYWVYLPSFRSRKEAEAAEKMLQKRGVKDIFVVADEANRNAVSLGVFSKRSGAVERQKKIRKLGYRPLLADRFRDTPNYWLDAKGSANQLPAAAVFSDLAEDDTAIGRADLPCAGTSG